MWYINQVHMVQKCFVFGVSSSPPNVFPVKIFVYFTTFGKNIAFSSLKVFQLTLNSSVSLALYLKNSPKSDYLADEMLRMLYSIPLRLCKCWKHYKNQNYISFDISLSPTNNFFNILTQHLATNYWHPEVVKSPSCVMARQCFCMYLGMQKEKKINI